MTDNRTPAELLAEARSLIELSQQRSQQYTAADAESMSPQQIVEARRLGQFDDLLGITRDN